MMMMMMMMMILGSYSDNLSKKRSWLQDGRSVMLFRRYIRILELRTISCCIAELLTLCIKFVSLCDELCVTTTE